MENRAWPAVDASAVEPGCESGQPLQPSERELLLALVAAMQALIDQMSSLSSALAGQNAILMDLMAERTADDDGEPRDLSGKPIR